MQPQERLFALGMYLSPDSLRTVADIGAGVMLVELADATAPAGRDQP